MKFRTHTDGPVSTHMTSMQGTIQASLLQLTYAFGKPRVSSAAASPAADGFYEWNIQFEDGSVATIYDWNRKVAPEPNEVIGWNIGGHDRRIAERVHDTYRHAHLGLKVAA